MDNKINPDELITPAQAARLKGVTTEWILSLLNRGKLQSTVIAGRRFVKTQDVINYKGKRGRPAKLKND